MTVRELLDVPLDYLDEELLMVYYGRIAILWNNIFKINSYLPEEDKTPDLLMELELILEALDVRMSNN